MSLSDLLQESTIPWLSDAKKADDVVLGTRVRLARNFRDFAFPNRANLNQLAETRLMFEKILPEVGRELHTAFDLADMEKLTPLQRNVLVEKQFISVNLTLSPQHRVAFISENRNLVVLVNEDDHLRIQCMAPGLDLAAPYELASKFDDLVEAQLDIAFDEKMGYLTSCPTNLGTGLRASVILHLPGLVFTKNIQNIMNISPQLGLAIRPIYGDNKGSFSNLFLLSNQMTLGFSESELLANLKTATEEIVTHEQQARKALLLYMKDRLEDDVYRSYGTLRYARILSEKETLELLSKIRLGSDLGMLDELTERDFSEILVRSGEGFLLNLAENENLSQNEIDRLRANKVREILLRHEEARKTAQIEEER